MDISSRQIHVTAGVSASYLNDTVGALRTQYFVPLHWVVITCCHSRPYNDYYHYYHRYKINDNYNVLTETRHQQQQRTINNYGKMKKIIRGKVMRCEWLGISLIFSQKSISPS